jgi:hypothetical protein
MNKHIDTILKSISRHKRGLRDPQIMHPEREWLIGILIALIIFVLSGTWSLTLYLKNRNATAEGQFEEQSETVVYRESMVNEALGRLRERDETLKSLLGNEETPIEPAIEESEAKPPTESQETATSSAEIPDDIEGRIESY